MFDPEQQEWLDKQREAYEKKLGEKMKQKQCCLIMVKPDGVNKSAQVEISDELTELNFDILLSEEKFLETEDAQFLYGSDEKTVFD